MFQRNNHRRNRKENNLSSEKTSQNSDIPTTIVKENADIFADFVRKINAAFKLSIFPNSLKLADITSLHKEGKKDLKENYRPVRILSNLSNVF